MRIREAIKSDIEQIRKIFSGAYIDEATGQTSSEDANYFTEQVEKALEDSRGGGRNVHYLVAEDENDGVAGFIGFGKTSIKLLPFTSTSKPVEIISLFVMNKQKGVGSRLVKKVEEITKGMGHTEIIVRSASRFRSSWAFYDKIGFIRVGIIKEITGKTTQVWTKEY